MAVLESDRVENGECKVVVRCGGSYILAGLQRDALRDSALVGSHVRLDAVVQCSRCSLDLIAVSICTRNGVTYNMERARCVYVCEFLFD